ncbi:MAG: DUF4350 domain-containing protein [Spirochaetaceae bacterium]|jgi:hypothetical protein|nr:DUF4350 domain-containing protein [Spirochaetaceae bacterium]
MGNYRTIFFMCLGFLVLLVWAGYTFFEIYPAANYRRPSAESRANEYLALDRWLQKTGHPLRTGTSGGLELPEALPEKTLLIQSSRFNWSGDVSGTFLPWVEAGGSLVIFPDLPWYGEKEAEGQRDFLERLGITTEKSYSFDEEEDGAAPSDAPGETPTAAEPAFDYQVRFILEEKPGLPAFTLKDRRGIIRLVTVFRGQGSVTVSGVPYFMWSSALREKQNARLAWRLTGGLDRENRGIYFVRGKEPASVLWGKLADRGDITALGVSALILVLIGFWMVLPAFGRFPKDEERPGKPIGERFRAESRFLRKYGALDLYLTVYVEELWAKLRVRRGIYRPDQMVPALAELWGMDAREVEKIIHPQGKLKYRDFVTRIRLIERTEERL